MLKQEGPFMTQIFHIFLAQHIKTSWKSTFYLVPWHILTGVRNINPSSFVTVNELSTCSFNSTQNSSDLENRAVLDAVFGCDFPDALSRGHELCQNVWWMPGHWNQMGGKASFVPVTAADLTDGNSLFWEGPCVIFSFDNCQRQNWVIWPRLSTSSFYWHHWVKNGTCEQITDILGELR